MQLLTQFLFRAAFGLALGMALTNSRQVTSGYFRNHLYVLLGFDVLATLVALTAPDRFASWPPLAAAVLCYFGAVSWLYEKPAPGKCALAGGRVQPGGRRTGHALVVDYRRSRRGADGARSGHFGPGAGVDVGGHVLGPLVSEFADDGVRALAAADRLGRNRRGAATATSAAGLALELNVAGWPSNNLWVLIGLRWLAGLIGTAAVFWMSWKTLLVPNTQSATGILYVGVITTFLGELTAMLLRAETAFPL